MIAETDLEPCTIATSIRPGDKEVYLEKTRVKVLEVLEVKMPAFKPELGKVVYRIDAGQGPQLVRAFQVKKRTDEEIAAHIFYIDARKHAIEQGMTKEVFDRKMKAIFPDLLTLSRFLRVKMMSPLEVMGAIHMAFAFILLIDSPIRRQGAVAELCQLWFIPPEMMMEEWESWQKKIGNQSVDQLVTAAVQYGHQVYETKHS